MPKSTLSKGKTAFLEYYSKLNLVPDIEKYLTRKNPPVLLISPFHRDELRSLWHHQHLSWTPLDWFPYAVSWPSEVHIGTPLPGFREGWLYSLNPSSLLPVLALDPRPGETILDAASAPGGKTLALAALLHPHSPTIIANDASLPRFKRLRTTLKLFGYPGIPVTRHPIQALSHHLTGQFDKILLDAPCSGEKHVFNSKRHLKLWSPNRIATLSHLQSLLIDSLLPLLSPGGTLVYSTCALTPAENEDVVAQALKSHPGFKLTRPAQRINDPDSGLDPMFIASLQKAPN